MQSKELRNVASQWKLATLIVKLNYTSTLHLIKQQIIYTKNKRKTPESNTLRQILGRCITTTKPRDLLNDCLNLLTEKYQSTWGTVLWPWNKPVWTSALHRNLTIITI